MKNLQWYFTDKSDWGEGPWMDEPDKAQWIDPATGLPCLIVRGPVGALCGYVGVDRAHPWHGLFYDDVYDLHGAGISVHGGLTFSDMCQENAEHGICHTVEPGDPDPVWWLGFDCSHLGDLAPKFYGQFALSGMHGEETYRTWDYVQAECAQLARQVCQGGGWRWRFVWTIRRWWNALRGL